MREDIMYVIVYPDGLIVMNTQKYFKSFCIKEWCKGCSRTWKQWYKRGYRCKKVKVTFEEAKNTKGEDFSTDHADTYKAVYYVEP